MARIFGPNPPPTHVLHMVGSAGKYWTVDVTDPTQPVVLNEYTETDPATHAFTNLSIDATNKNIYISNSASNGTQGEIFCYNIVNPVSPTLRGIVATLGDCDAVAYAADDDYTYCTSGEGSGSSHQYVESVDVSDPDAMTVDANLTSSSYGGLDTVNIDESRNALFCLARITDDLIIVNITNPSSLSTHAILALTSSTNWGFHGMDYDPAQDYLFLADQANSKILPVDVTTIGSPVEGTGVALNTITNASRVRVDSTNGYAYVSSGTGTEGWESYDISTPGSPSFSGYLAYPDSAGSNGMCLDARGYLWTIRNTKLTCVDISNPAAMSVVTSITLSAGSWLECELEVVT